MPRVPARSSPAAALRRGADEAGGAALVLIGDTPTHALRHRVRGDGSDAARGIGERALANVSGVAALRPGQCPAAATPAGGSTEVTSGRSIEDPMARLRPSGQCVVLGLDAAERGISDVVCFQTKMKVHEYKGPVYATLLTFC